MPAPLIPDVALVELPPMKLRGRYDKEKRKKKQSDWNIPLLVEKKDIGTTLEESMWCRKAGKTAANYDDLSHLGKRNNG